MRKWITDALIRAIKTVAQTAIGVIGASYVLTDVSWQVVASASVLAGITSLLMSVAKMPGGEDDENQ